jgi:hypothetical protein
MLVYKVTLETAKNFKIMKGANNQPFFAARAVFIMFQLETVVCC